MLRCREAARGERQELAGTSRPIPLPTSIVAVRLSHRLVNGDVPYVRERSKVCDTNHWRFRMSNGWTPERRAGRAELIRTRKQWQQVTEPRTPDSQAKVSRNAYQRGLWLRPRELSHLINAEAREARDLERLLLKRWFDAGTPIH